MRARSGVRMVTGCTAGMAAVLAGGGPDRITGTGRLDPFSTITRRPVTYPRQLRAAQPTWYYCDSAKGYYPYVRSCASGWRAVAANEQERSAP